MLDPAQVVRHIEDAGFTHVVWIPDSYVGHWESALASSSKLRLIRPCREGEAIAIAGGLMLGGTKPLVVIQCTGLFEAGDALRNIVHDLKRPLKLILGVRSYNAYLAGKSADNCPFFMEPIVRAWQLPHTTLAEPTDATFAKSVCDLAASVGPHALLLGE
jgi:sulfopyruvate decarboxylase TPP-binding subunit